MKRGFRELNSIFTVMAREITIYFKSPFTAVMGLAMPLVMMGMIGGNLEHGGNVDCRIDNGYHAAGLKTAFNTRPVAVNVSFRRSVGNDHHRVNQKQKSRKHRSNAHRYAANVSVRRNYPNQ